MTTAAANHFEDLWPVLARRLHTMLAAKRVPPHKRDDIVQETGLRLFAMWAQVDPKRSIWGLTVTIALNLLRDEARRHPEREVLGLVPDRPTDCDVETVGLARIELRRVRDAMARLSPDHRSVLLAEVGDEQIRSPRGPNATKMLRMRARRRLTALLDVASASGLFLGVRLKRLFNAEHYVVALRNLAGRNEEGLAAAAAGLIAAMSVFSVTSLPGSLPGGTHAELAGKGSRHGESRTASGAGSSSLVDVTTERALERGRGLGDANVSTEHDRRAVAARGRGSMAGGGSTRDDYEPLHVPLGSDGYVEGGAQVSVLGTTVEVGDRGSRPPLCVSFNERVAVNPNVQCEEREGSSSNSVSAGAGAAGSHTSMTVRT